MPLQQSEQRLVSNLQAMAKDMRLKALEMALGAGTNGAHLGPALSSMEIMATLYGHVLRCDKDKQNDPNRDRMLVSKAHTVLSYYTALYEAGFLTEAELMTFEKPNTCFAGHPSTNIAKGIEYAGGSLGMALSFGVGIALDIKRKKKPGRVFVLLGDGELDEGANWEAFMAAAHYNLDNMFAIIDKNQLQYDGLTEDVMALGNLSEKLQSFGWHVIEVDGHDIAALINAFEAPNPKRPIAIIATTVKGKGVSFMEGAREWHHAVLSQAQYEQACFEIVNGG